jgi:hypothetical protein
MSTSEVYVLFLPENEIHELGLMYLNYELSLRAKKTIYLGQSIPLDNLNALTIKFENVIFISSFTVSPVESKLMGYLKELDALLYGTRHRLSVYGFRVKDIDTKLFKSPFSFYSGLLELLEKV